MAHGAETYAIYARQSLDQTGDGMAVARQIEDCRALAELLHLDGQAVVYADNDVSASRGKPRPEYERLMSALRAGEHQALVVWHNDRLHRRPTELEEFIAVAEAIGLKIHTVQAGDFDLTTPSGRMVARILGAAARQEVEHKGERRKRANQQRRERGIRLPSGRRQFGYGRTIEDNGVQRVRDYNKINRGEAAAIRNAVERLLAGEPADSIYGEWNARGLRGARGAEWNWPRFWKMIRRPSLAGFVTYHDDVVGTAGKWPAILTKQQSREVTELYAASRIRQPGRRRVPVTGLFDDFAHCASCNQRLRLKVRDRSGSEPAELYKCPATRGGPHTAIVAHMLDPVVLWATAGVLAEFRGKIEAFDVRAAELANTRADLMRLYYRRRRLLDAIEEGVATAAAVASRLESIAASESHLRQRRDALVAGLRHGRPPGPVESAASDFIKSVGSMTGADWPAWFIADNPELVTASIRGRVEQDLRKLERPVLQCVARAAVHVTVRHARHGRDDVSRLAITAVPTSPTASYSYDDAMAKRGQVVIDGFLGRIVSGDLKEGVLLPTETEMIEQYGISRTAVREAVQALASKGLVVIRQGSGSRVAPRSRWNVLDREYLAATGLAGDLGGSVHEANQILEPAIAGLAAQRATDNQIELLRQLAENGSESEFHYALAEAANNPVLASLYASVTHLSDDDAGDEPSRPRTSEWHHRIVKAIEEKDPDAARDAMRVHLREDQAVSEDATDRST